MRPAGPADQPAPARAPRGPRAAPEVESARPRPVRPAVEQAFGGKRYVVADGRRYDLAAPRGTYVNMLI